MADASFVLWTDAQLGFGGGCMDLGMDLGMDADFIL